MAGPNLTELSQNWKILQRRLDSGKDQSSQTKGIKRKREDEKKKSTNGFKKSKRSATGSNIINPPSNTAKLSKMGSYLSAASNPPPPPVSAEDIPTETLPADHADSINTGLHPTHKPGRYVALDCEMVGTGPPPHTDNVLARASLVNYHGEQIYDSYVLPPPNIRVEDYRTHVSGIRAEHISPGSGARTFSQVQADVAKLLDGRVLVGHALKNDLTVLMLSHAKRDVRDTSRHKKFRELSGGRPPALRDLSRRELGMVIQTGEHSSLEDARAAMGLFRKEKLGFEEENRKIFGIDRRKTSALEKKKDSRKEVSDDDDEDEVEDGEELDLLEGEEDEDEQAADKVATSKTGKHKGKKKRKTKKRTKRK